VASALGFTARLGTSIKVVPDSIMVEESAPILQGMRPLPQVFGKASAGKEHQDLSHGEDTPAYRTLLNAGLLNSSFRKKCFEDIFDGIDLKANSSKDYNLKQQCMYGVFCCPIVGCMVYGFTHIEMFIPAGHVGLLLDEKQRYLFAQPGMHNINSIWIKHTDTKPLPNNLDLNHGNRTILVVEQGFIGLAFDNGQPVLFPPGIHVWTSETLKYQSAISLDSHKIALGPYTLLTVDEGYAAVTQNNGKQQILSGGATHLLDHKNWRFEKFLTLKIQTDDLEKIMATSADNITMMVTSTVTWRIVDPLLAATMAADTMALSGSGAVSSDIKKLRGDVLKQAIASLASFMGGVNYSDSFHMAAQVQGKKTSGLGTAASDRMSLGEPESEARTNGSDNPLYDPVRMSTSVCHANQTTMSYGVKILSINILSAVPCDAALTKALACGAVASAQALQSETAARGNAKAMRIDAEAVAEKVRIEADGAAQAELIRAKAQGESARLVADGNKKAADLLSTSAVAVELAKMDKSAKLIGPSDKFFFGQEPAYLANLILKDGALPSSRAPGKMPEIPKAGLFG
jgi:regulator of protease activity HflC (stomatin/prohibitin superfamily)